MNTATPTMYLLTSSASISLASRNTSNKWHLNYSSGKQERSWTQPNSETTPRQSYLNRRKLRSSWCLDLKKHLVKLLKIRPVFWVKEFLDKVTVLHAVCFELHLLVSIQWSAFFNKNSFLRVESKWLKWFSWIQSWKLPKKMIINIKEYWNCSFGLQVLMKTLNEVQW